MRGYNIQGNMTMDEKILNISKKYYPFIAAITAAISLYIGLSLAGMLTGGVYVYLRGDLLESHVAYILDMCNSIRNGESIWYSYTISMGMNTSLVLAYYTLSPFNILFLIFNEADVNFLAALITIMKLSLAAAFFQVFIKRLLKAENLWSIILSVCYALCGFAAVYGTYHIMWLDGFMMLPLLCFLIVRAFEKNKYVAVSLCYAYIFICQFYIGFMVGLFSFLFVLAYLAYSYNHNFKEILMNFLKWIASVMAAVLISAVVWLPALIFLIANNPPDATQFRELEATFMEIINSMFWGQYIDNIGRKSFSYSGLLSLLIVPFYFFNKRFPIKERVISGLFLAFLLLCYVVPPLYAIMHANDAPDFFWYRFSFLFSFLVCAIAVRELQEIDTISAKKILILLLGFVFFYVVEQRLATLENTNYVASDIYNLLINIAFFLAWMAIIIGYQRVKKNKGALCVLALLLVAFETSSNMMTSLDNKSLESEYSNYEFIDKTGIDYINSIDNDFYRVIIRNDMIHNSDSQFGYHGVTDVGSGENYHLRDTLSNLGFGTTPRMSMATGYNPVNEMLLGVRYNVYGVYYHDFGYRNYDVNDVVGVEKNETALNVGYMVNEDILQYDFPSRNVFENLNTLTRTMSGVEEDCFEEISKDSIHYTYKNCLVYMLEDTGEYYYEKEGDEGIATVLIDPIENADAYVQFEVKEPSISQNSPGIETGVVNSVNAWDPAIMSSAGFQIQPVAEGFQYSFGTKENASPIYVFDDINYYYYKHGSVEKHFAELSKEQFVVTDYSNGHITGHVNSMSPGKLLFITIPYDDAWSVTINGNKAEIVPILNDAFMAIKLPGEGDFEIALNYETPGLKKGIVITCIGLFICLVWAVLE